MAKRMYFVPNPDGRPVYDEIFVEFEYFNGFALSQKQKSIRSMHSAIAAKYPGARVLEVSTKSWEPIGVKLSAFNLLYRDESGKEYHLENIFQSSKAFEHGGPYRDLLGVPPKDAKRDERLRSSGALRFFEYDSRKWPLEPRSIFYDWIYLTALRQNTDLAEEILAYNAFTDIEFNHAKSFNCQARSAAIFVALMKSKRLDIIDTPDFLNVYAPQQMQTSLFDAEEE